MRKLVLDASVIVKWFRKEEGFEKALFYFRLLKEGKVRIFEPELLKYELMNALIRGKGIGIKEALDVLQSLYEIGIIFISEDLSLSKITSEIAVKYEITYYDASYIALAKSLEAEFVTADIRHQAINLKGLRIVTI